MYFDNGIVVETLPGTVFKIKVDRSSKDGEAVEPIFIICKLKTKLIKRRVLIIKGDKVVIEVNPEDMSYNSESNLLKGTIIERK